MRTKEGLLNVTAAYWKKQGNSRSYAVAKMWEQRDSETSMTDISNACDKAYGCREGQEA